MEIVIEAAVCNNIGLVRKNNEDNFFLNGIYMPKEEMDRGAAFGIVVRDQRQLYAVCDGMGGTEAGEEAALMAAEGLGDWKEKALQIDGEEEITKTLRIISRQIFESSEEMGISFGTTLAALAVEENTVRSVNTGDSRVYLFRRKELRQLSFDHSKVQKMVSMGLITQEQARTDPNRHVILQFLGMPDENKLFPYYSEVLTICRGDLFLLCSDGLTDMLADKDIEKILSSRRNLLSSAKRLVDTALKKGGRDNITVLLARVKRAGEKTWFFA